MTLVYVHSMFYTSVQYTAAKALFPLTSTTTSHVLPPYSPGCVSAGLATWVRTAPRSVGRDGGVLGASMSASAPEVRLPAMPPLALATRTAQRDSQDPNVTCVSS